MCLKKARANNSEKTKTCLENGWWGHDGGGKTFKSYWNKLNCRTFKYVSAKDKPLAKSLADDWLAMMGAKHGLAAPAITF